MTSFPQTAVTHVDAPAPFPRRVAAEPARASGLRLPPVQRRLTTLRRPDPLFSTLEEYVALARRLREDATRG